MTRNEGLKTFARKLRREQTDAERALWQRLKGKQLDGVKFRRQQPIGPYIVDFASFEKKLVIEIDGGQHSEMEIADRDEARTGFLEAEGFKVIRFWNNDVTTKIEGVMETIGNALGLEFHPLPASPIKGEGFSRNALRFTGTTRRTE